MVAQLYEVLRIIAVLVFYLLASLLTVSIVLVFERMVRLRRYARELNGLREQVTTALSKGRISAVNPNTLPDDFVGRVIAKALLNIGRTPEALNETVNAEVANNRSELERGLNFLGTMGANAPFIGLFGTVLGIMAAFQDMAMAAHPGPQVVMSGISEALIATAAGLLVAIPDVIFYNYLKNRVKSIMMQTESLFREILAYAVDTFEFERLAQVRRGTDKTEDDKKDALSGNER